MFKVTKFFVAGLLKGLTITETTSVKFVVGKTYRECVGSGAYTVIECTGV